MATWTRAAVNMVYEDQQQLIVFLLLFLSSPKRQLLHFARAHERLVTNSTAPKVPATSSEINNDPKLEVVYLASRMERSAYKLRVSVERCCVSDDLRSCLSWLPYRI